MSQMNNGADNVGVKEYVVNWSCIKR